MANPTIVPDLTATSPRIAKGSFAQFVFPFTMHVDDDVQIDARLEHASHKGQRIWERLDIAKEYSLYDLTQQIRLDSMSLWKISEEALRDWLGFGERPWELRGAGGVGIEWKLETVRLWWFENRIGLLVFSARPLSSDPATWLSFLYYLRFVDGSQQRKIRPMPIDGPPVMPPWIASTPAGSPAPWTSMRQLVQALRATLDPPSDAPDPWRSLTDPGQLFPFTCVFVDQMPSNEQPLFRHRLRQSLRTDQAENAASEDLVTSGNSYFLPYADQQWFTFSMGGAGFVAFDRPDNEFNHLTLPSHLAKRYGFILVLALYQRYTLIEFSRETARYWERQHWERQLDNVERLPGQNVRVDTALFDQMERLYVRLLTFTAYGYFAQVVQQDHYHRFFRRWVEVFQLPTLYEEVRGEIAEMRNYLDLRLARRTQEQERAAASEEHRRITVEQRQLRAAEDQARRLEQRIGYFAVFLGFPALFLTAAAATGDLPPLFVALWAVIGGAAGWIFLDLFNSGSVLRKLGRHGQQGLIRLIRWLAATWRRRTKRGDRLR